LRLSLWRGFFTLTKTKVSTQHSRTASRLCWRLTHTFCAVNTPDIATRNFQLLQNAYATVSNTSRRKAYDAELATSDAARKTPGPRERRTKSGSGSQNVRQQRARGRPGGVSVAQDHVRRRVVRSNRVKVAKGTGTPRTLPNVPWPVQFVFTQRGCASLRAGQRTRSRSAPVRNRTISKPQNRGGGGGGGTNRRRR
jgi:curved DNA-binding protein CbpA